MSFVVSFTDYRPIRRYPPITTPWTQARIEEATAEDGPWTTIDTITLSPVDSDPTDPQTRSFSTGNATLTVGWYRVVWLDAAGREDITDPRPHPAGTSATGQPYFTIDEFRTRYPDLTELEGWSDEKIDAARTLAERAFEDACGRAFVPRTATGTLGLIPRTSDSARRLRRRDLRSIATATDLNGTPIDLAGLTIADGWVRLASAWPTGVVTVSYTYGLDAPPERVKHAVMALARQWMIDGPVTARATQLSTEGGGVINQATPGSFGSLFGIPEVDACVQIYGATALALA